MPILTIDVEPNCRHGCPAIENTITNCKYLDQHYMTLKQYLTNNKITWESNNILGLNPSLTRKICEEVRIQSVLESGRVDTNKEGRKETHRRGLLRWAPQAWGDGCRVARYGVITKSNLKSKNC
ncbi:Uncharacterized protein APZ42_020534 [Daphnia magna]|uniref:Uncharacterized protein n=1 Tax=Daphnia magna TaxID=35525 RepID=A0A164X6C8_9CRUS|nr:Uncharacterized protein APZ42_020534 [Daphnia magna]